MSTGPNPNDLLEDTRASDNPYVGDRPLPEDNDRPAAPAEDPRGVRLPDTHPAEDSEMESSEVYGEGKPETAEAAEPSEENAREIVKQEEES